MHLEFSVIDLFKASHDQLMPGTVIADIYGKVHPFKGCISVDRASFYIFPWSQLLPLMPSGGIQHECQDPGL